MPARGGPQVVDEDHALGGAHGQPLRCFVAAHRREAFDDRLQHGLGLLLAAVPQLGEVRVERVERGLHELDHFARHLRRFLSWTVIAPCVRRGRIETSHSRQKQGRVPR
jgi:hypothetical protein